MTQRVALYARYSSENQREASIEDQYRNCENYAKRQERWKIVERYEDKAISGSTDANGRPGYRQMLADAQAKRFEVLLVDDFSRLSRDSSEIRRTCRWQEGILVLMRDIFLRRTLGPLR